MLDLDKTPVCAHTFTIPGFIIHLYTDNNVVIYDERAQSAIKIPMGTLGTVTTVANKTLRQIREALAAKVKAAQAADEEADEENSEPGVDGAEAKP